MMPGQNFVVPKGKSLIEKMWDKVDELVKMHYEPDEEQAAMSPIDKAKYQGVALGITECILLISEPHFKNITEVRRHAKLRYLISIGKADPEPTPGVKGYNPMPPPREPRRKRPLPFTPLSDNDKVAIKGALANGLRVDTLASVYGVTERQIRELE
jgi:hypothetical protein